MLQMTRKGLYCPAGDFYIDPSGAVDRAVVTHAHSDHARRGGKLYYCTTSGVSLLKARLGQKIAVESHDYGRAFYIGPVRVSFHSAGHILGSSQVRLELDGEVWVASGDYKRDEDPTCEPFEVVNCDVFVTEATFGTPAYRWKKNKNIGREIFEWWEKNAVRGINSVLFAYSLGKAQRVLGLLADYAERPVYCYPTITPINECYRAQGIDLAETICLNEAVFETPARGEFFLVPQAFLKSEQARVLGDRFETAFASGWMATDDRGFDKGFVLSDHADWDDLLMTIEQSRARRVYVQHRGAGALVRHLKSLGVQAFPDTALFPENPNQMSLF